ncbi:type 1 glutamine amidotransferase [Pyxidicoccus xibeiensis]|uniref:type 1 glutamine amidotransferase n=1 Tax=Pyxidicoccus xibeiensis TaxID=2906759 RepID=UPI0020A6E55A|nr:glutamine amidotransferase [Pyxidicoccus xibeiensis]MCP3142344.1 glutamine amidotransferase [Pyxidicoccus xibeiensis]
MRAVVFQHEEHEGAGLLGPVLQEAGFTLVNRFRTVKREDVDADLVVVMGGPMGVYEAEQHPFLHDELALLTERLAYERPCLGICLGAQLLASAAGAEVFVGKNGFEVGVAPVRWTQDGLKDPVIAGVRPKTVVAHWHGDTWKPVPDAALLASTDRYSQQAFRLGKSYGFQFHLELTATEMGRWLDLGAEDLQQRGKDLQELKSQLPKLKAAEAENIELLHRLARHFAEAAGR